MTASQSAPPKVEPLSGWCLNYITALDRDFPGVAGAFLRSSSERRQVCAALMAMKPVPTDRSQRASLADRLTKGSHREILLSAFKSVPHGMRGALARSGPQPHAPAFYRVLHELLSSPAHRKTAAVIRQLDALDLMRLRITIRLPDDIRTTPLVNIMESSRMAADVVRLVHLLSAHGLDREGLAEALRRVSTPDQFSRLWERWSEKLVFPRNPLAASEHYTPINTGEQLRRLALRYRNCARRYLAQVMVGEHAFGEFQWDREGGVVLLTLSNRAWILDSIFGKDNAIPGAELRRAVESYCREQGVATNLTRRNDAGEWAVLRRLSNPFRY